MTLKIDLYTKIVLTVIAGCLLYLCFGKPAMTATAHAQGAAGPQLVRVDGVVPVRIAAIERLQDTQTGQWSEWQTIATKAQP